MVGRACPMSIDRAVGSDIPPHRPSARPISMPSRRRPAAASPRVLDVDVNVALHAAGNGLPWADGLIHATALDHGAESWIPGAHFEGLPGVRCFPKKA
jgi:hypothetical protein